MDLATAKTHCRVDISDTTSDSLINLYIGAATQAAEAYLKRTLAQTQYLLTRDLLPNNGLNGPTGSAGFNAFLNSSVYPYTLDGVFKILKPPLISVDQIAYLNTSGAWVTLDPSYYAIVTGTPGRIAPAYGKVWPFVLPQIGGVKITYTAGVASVPFAVQAAILLRVGSLYRNRESVTEGTLVELPFGERNLLDSASPGFYR